MGLVILGAMALYLIVSIMVVVAATRSAKRNDKSPWRWGGGAALVMYLLVFWDHIPTVITHKYYCATEAGFWVYKTVDQWKAENPGVLETLIADKNTPSISERGDGSITSTYLRNSRFNWVVTQRDASQVFPIIRMDQKVVDREKNEVLARYVDFGSGNRIDDKSGPPGSVRFWMVNHHCDGGGLNQDVLRNFRNGVTGAIK